MGWNDKFEHYESEWSEYERIESDKQLKFDFMEKLIECSHKWRKYSNGVSVSEPSFTLTTSCNHKWKKYVGLSESFTYCEVCDAKKGE